MRLNLNFKDATITQTSQSEYRIVFDISNMIRPRLSQDARMYIEHLNFPEFLDEAFGDKGQLRGYFELICENIQNDDYDSDYGNGGNCVLYTSPLTNFKTFTNNDPMYISNFKINSNFLKDRLVFILKIYDQNGNPYDTAETIIQEINTGSADYGTFKTAVTELDNLNKELDALQLKYDEIDGKIKDKESDVVVSRQQLQIVYDDVKTQMVSTIKNGSTATRTKLKIELFKVLFQTFTKSNLSYLFEIYINSKSGNSPFYTTTNLGKALTKYYDVYLNYVEEEMKLDRLIYLRKALQGSSNPIWYEVEPSFTTITNIEPELLTLDYKVPVLSGVAKTGKIMLDCFTSVLKSKQFITIYDIIPTTSSGNENDLVSAEILEIEASKFNSIIPQTYTYTFAKSDIGNDEGVTLTTTNNKRNCKFLIDISREISITPPSSPSGTPPPSTTPTTTYSFKLLENKDKYTIISEGFTVGDELLFKGDYLGGELGTNDYILQVDSIYVPPTEEVISFTNIFDVQYPTNGTFSIGIKRTNSPATDYIINSYDYSNTSGFVVGDVLNFSGTDLNGDDGPNDLSLTIDKVIDAETEYLIDSGDVIFTILHPEINVSNTTIVDATGAAISGRTPTDFTINVKSVEDDYFITWDISTDTSSGFLDGDVITIDGTILSGESGTNDLNITITADATANGKLLSVVASPAKSRYPTSYQFKFNFEANNPNYFIEVVTPDINLKDNDILTISGDTFGGKNRDGTILNNELKIVVNVVTTTDAAGLSSSTTTLTVTGTPIDIGNKGAIKSVSESGQGKYYPTLGKILALSAKSAASNTPVDISTLTKSNMTIKLTQVVPKNYKRGMSAVKSKITAKYTTIDSAKKVLVKNSSKYITSLASYQKNKLNCMNMRLILYNEIPDYTQSSGDAISGNTYSRLHNCQIRRIT